MKKFKLKCLSTLKRFGKDSSGQIAVMLAVLTLPMSVLMGSGIDWSQKVSATAKMQSTIDSAILAVARELSVKKALTQAQMEATAKRIFDINISVSSNVTFDNLKLTYIGEVLKITQKGSVKTSFLNLVNIESMDVLVESEVNMKFSGVDLALAVDLSGSMYGTKLSELKKATKLLLTELGNANVTDMRVAFVPWTRGVNVGSYRAQLAGNNKYNYATPNYSWKNNSEKYYTSRGYNIDDCVATRSDGKLSENNTTTNHGREAYCPEAELIPLTSLSTKVGNDTKTGAEKLSDIVNTWKAKGGTGSHNGMYWAWATLDTAFHSTFGTPAVVDAPSTKKYAIIMTDGLNNGYNNGKDFNNKMLAACTEMKKNGISIYAIVLMENSSTVKNTFQACASPDVGGRNFFIKTSKASDLSDDFKTIAEEIGQFHLSK